MITLFTRNGSKTGNAILYGGQDRDDPQDPPLFYVETDYGNHMKLTWSEIMSMFAVGRPCSYDDWRADRRELGTKLSYLVPDNKDKS